MGDVTLVDAVAAVKALDAEVVWARIADLDNYIDRYPRAPDAPLWRADLALLRAAMGSGPVVEVATVLALIADYRAYPMVVMGETTAKEALDDLADDVTGHAWLVKEGEV